MRICHSLLLSCALVLAPGIIWAATVSEEAKPPSQSKEWTFDSPIFEEVPFNPTILAPIQPTHSESDQAPAKNRALAPKRSVN